MVYGIIAVIAVAAISYFNAANNENKVNNEIQNINSLSSTIRSMFNSQGDYSGLSNTEIIKSDSFPERMRVPGSISLIKNSWLNAGVIVIPVNNMGTANDSFNIMYSGVPEKDCSSFVSRTFRFFNKVMVNGILITNLAIATTACRNGSNSVIFTSR